MKSADTTNVEVTKNERILIVLTSHTELGDTGKKTGFWLPEFTYTAMRGMKTSSSTSV